MAIYFGIGDTGSVTYRILMQFDKSNAKLYIHYI